MLNKADRFPDAERAEARTFCERMLAERLRRPAAPILEVSATERLATSGEPALAELPRSVGAEVGFRAKSRFYYADLMRMTAGSPLQWTADLLRSRQSLQGAVLRRCGEYLETLLHTNATRIENDFNDRVLESRRLLEAEIRRRLRELHTSAGRALDRARARLSEGRDAVKSELERIEGLRRRAEDLLNPIPDPKGDAA
ncbi:MAG: hypothetical protein HYY06_33330 [Deltaproteobacteria bacterium]|nr:hypothetical protein [Deltaproteobacteria bacterium]